MAQDRGCTTCGSFAWREGHSRCKACRESMFRDADPETSRNAAGTVDVNAREAEVLSALRLLVVASHTAEIQDCLDTYGIRRERNCIARRLTSLVRNGFVAEQGTKPGPYGREVTCYRLTPLGERRAQVELRKAS